MPVGVDYRPWLLVHCRVVGFETEVEAEQKVCEVHAQADAVGGRNLFGEVAEAEKSARLVGVAAYGPYVAGVDEYRPLENPEEFVAVFEVEYQRYVAALIYEVGYGVACVVGAGAEGAHTPSAHTVCSSGIETFLERNHSGVAVGVADAEAGVERQ